MRADRLILFLITGRKQAIFTNRYDVSCRFFTDAFYQVKEVSVSSFRFKKSGMDVGFCRVKEEISQTQKGEVKV